MYKIIRKANIILSRMDEVTDMSNQEITGRTREPTGLHKEKYDCYRNS